MSDMYQIIVSGPGIKVSQGIISNNAIVIIFGGSATSDPITLRTFQI